MKTVEIEAAFAWLMANRQYNPEGKLPPQQWERTRFRAAQHRFDRRQQPLAV